ncbi:hypothetical protein GCM10019016_126870 [Streptomyces prasinosporus]|uniref:Uncharacterized protein n=1 Tax=Streptomyces prasinosporus TaxID=68256 RepID=A0ABP6UDP4_9ACTN
MGTRRKLAVGVRDAAGLEPTAAGGHRRRADDRAGLRRPRRVTPVLPRSRMTRSTCPRKRGHPQRLTRWLTRRPSRRRPAWTRGTP